MLTFHLPSAILPKKKIKEREHAESGLKNQCIKVYREETNKLQLLIHHNPFVHPPLNSESELPESKRMPWDKGITSNYFKYNFTCNDKHLLVLFSLFPESIPPSLSTDSLPEQVDFLPSWLCNVNFFTERDWSDTWTSTSIALVSGIWISFIPK